MSGKQSAFGAGGNSPTLTQSGGQDPRHELRLLAFRKWLHNAILFTAGSSPDHKLPGLNQGSGCEVFTWVESLYDKV